MTKKQYYPKLRKQLDPKNIAQLFKIGSRKTFLTYESLIHLNLFSGGKIKNWNPATYYFILAERNEIHILDLQIFLRILRNLKVTLERVYFYRYQTHIISEDPTMDFLIARLVQKMRSIYFSANKWIPGTLTNFKQNVTKFFQKFKFIRIKRPKRRIKIFKLTYGLIKERFGRMGIKKMNKLVALAKKGRHSLKLPATIFLYSLENSVLTREVYDYRKLTFSMVSSDSRTNNIPGYLLPLNPRGVIPKLFWVSFLKEFILLLKTNQRFIVKAKSIRLPVVSFIRDQAKEYKQKIRRIGQFNNRRTINHLRTPSPQLPRQHFDNTPIYPLEHYQKPHKKWVPAQSASEKSSIIGKEITPTTQSVKREYFNKKSEVVKK
jgi:hypothetical protein